MKYKLFVVRQDDTATTPQHFANLELLHQEDDQMVEEIAGYLNEAGFRDCIIHFENEDKEV